MAPQTTCTATQHVLHKFKYSKVNVFLNHKEVWYQPGIP